MSDYEKEPFGTADTEPDPKPNRRPVGSNERRCKNCNVWRKEKGIGADFICKHIRGYAEAPAKVRRCHSCNVWKKERGIKGDFWCKHNKFKKKEWDSSRGWRGASARAKEIGERRQRKTET